MTVPGQHQQLHKGRCNKKKKTRDKREIKREKSHLEGKEDESE
jgi:hypothetical protein